MRWLFLLEQHSFLSFTMRCTNYNWIEIKTGLKGILESVPPGKNSRKTTQNVFYVYIAISQSLWWFKVSLERFTQMKYCFSDQICNEQNHCDLKQYKIKYCYFLLRFWINRVECLFHCNTDALPCSVKPSA